MFVSNLIDDAIRNNASASAISSDPLTGASYALAVAVAYGKYVHNSNAYVGQSVIINAAKIGVAANTLLPNTNTWLQWDSLGGTLSHLNGNFGIVGNIVTSYSNATADGGATLGLAGSVSYFGVTEQHDRVGRDGRQPDRDLHGHRLMERVDRPQSQSFGRR